MQIRQKSTDFDLQSAGLKGSYCHIQAIPAFWSCPCCSGHCLSFSRLLIHAVQKVLLDLKSLSLVSGEGVGDTATSAASIRSQLSNSLLPIILRIWYSLLYLIYQMILSSFLSSALKPSLIYFMRWLPITLICCCYYYYYYDYCYYYINTLDEIFSPCASLLRCYAK